MKEINILKELDKMEFSKKMVRAKFSYHYPEIYFEILKLIRHKTITPITLDKDIEELFKDIHKSSIFASENTTADGIPHKNYSIAVLNVIDDELYNKLKQSFLAQASEIKRLNNKIWNIQELLDLTPKDIRDIATYTYEEIKQIIGGKE